MMKTTVIKTPEEFINFCIKLKPIFSLDVETTSLEWLDLEIIGFSICDGVQACYVDLVQNKQELLNILEFYISEAKLIVMHNSPFDMMVLKKYGVEI